jgi:sigma-B regulation protein RsbU (phosphoserine phosphatase)
MALGTLTYTNAGHYPPVLVRADGTVERLQCGGAVLGVFSDGGYEQGQVAIGSGDRIVCYTDGVTEAHNDRDEEYGEDRLVAAVVENRCCSAPALQARLAEEVAAFTNNTFQDDATLIVLALD